jgi:pimeloyl-ACP methyl ester carboxylesterase
MGIGSAAVLLCLLLAGGGAAYNALALRHYRQVAGVPGKLYDVGGHAMHLYCTGEGSPTVVLSAGLGDDVTGWAKVQPVLSQLTRVCSYDRAGYGWSEAFPGVQDATEVAAELHELLLTASVDRPVVLVGHSISGMYLRAYAARFPADLAALVFVDGATPLQDDLLPKEMVRLNKEWEADLPRQKLLRELGWNRLKGECTEVPAGFEAYSQWIKADQCMPSQMDAMQSELEALKTSGDETVHAGPFGSLPVLVLSADPKVLMPEFPAAVSREFSATWNGMQEETKGLSSQSRRVIAQGSGHNLQIDRPDVLNKEVGTLVVMLRHQQPMAGVGTTAEE